MSDAAPDAAHRPPRGRVTTLALVAIGLAIGGVIGLGILALIDRGSSSTPTFSLDAGTFDPAVQQDNARSFLVAWQRFRTATYVAELTLHRETTGAASPLDSTGRLAQRPPQRLVTAFGGATSSFGDALSGCDTVPGTTATVCGPSGATTGDPMTAYQADVRNELAVLASYLAGDDPLYRVDLGTPQCWILGRRPTATTTAAPYGDRATFCFDEATGAPRRFTTAGLEGTDVLESTAIRTEVTDADLRVGSGS